MLNITFCDAKAIQWKSFLHYLNNCLSYSDFLATVQTFVALLTMGSLIYAVCKNLNDKKTFRKKVINIIPIINNKSSLISIYIDQLQETNADLKKTGDAKKEFLSVTIKEVEKNLLAIELPEEAKKVLFEYSSEYSMRLFSAINLSKRFIDDLVSIKNNSELIENGFFDPELLMVLIRLQQEIDKLPLTPKVSIS
jgi:hypothetical protein